MGFSAEDDADAPKEKIGLETASEEGAAETVSFGFSTDGTGAELDGGVLNENADFVDVSDPVVKELVAGLLGGPKMLILGKGASPIAPGAPKEKADLGASADPFTCGLASLPKGDETSAVEAVDALLADDELPNRDADEPPNTEGLLTLPNGSGFGSFDVSPSFFSSLLDRRGCSVDFSLSPLGNGEPNKEPEGTLGAMNCTFVFAKKDGIAPSPGVGAGVAAEGVTLGVGGAAKGLEITSGLGIEAGGLDTPKLKGNVAGAVLDDVK